MGTNVVKKGANRAGAAASRSRHAQRTPLPPKGSKGIGNPTAEALKKSVAEGKAKKAASKARKTPSVKGLADLLPGASKPRPAKKSPAKKAAAGKPGATWKADDSFPHPKLGEFLLDAEKSGWEARYEQAGDDIVGKAWRSDETVTVMWHASRFIEADYSHAGRTIKLRNVSHARQVMAVPSEEVSTPMPRQRRSLETPSAPRTVRRKLPWGENPLDEEVLAAVVGHTIVWRTDLTDTYEEARIGKTLHQTVKVPLTDDKDKVVKDKYDKPKMVDTEVQITNKHLKIEEAANGKRVLSFTEESGPFRACYVDAIVAVK